MAETPSRPTTTEPTTPFMVSDNGTVSPPPTETEEVIDGADDDDDEDAESGDDLDP
ncbi:MAG: hypothetical protein Q9212_005779, partial [Teloschistes hypoglaucus]